MDSLITAQVMSRHERLHHGMGHFQRMMGGPGNPNANPMAEQQFNALFTQRMAAEIVIMVRLIESGVS